ncbi:MAG: AsmA family protein [Chromatiales bacterium]|nr:AsmA family protein [Chromatiales bacterium]
MGKLFKVIGILVAAVVLLVVTAVIVLPMVIDPNDYKEEIVNQVQAHTGRQLTIEGDLNLSVFPWLGIDIGAMQLSNAPGFEPKNFAAVKHAAVRVKLMPLLSSRLEVDTIGLDGLELNLAKRKDGSSNWDDLAQGSGQQTEKKMEQPDPSGDQGMALTGLSIGGIDINNAMIRWDDRTSGQLYEISPFNLKSGAIVPGKPVDLNMDLQLTSKAPQMGAKVTLTGSVNLDQDNGKLAVNGLKLTADAQGEALPGGSLQAELVATIAAALNGESLSVSGLQLSVGDLKLSGQLNGKDLAGLPTFTGNIQLAELNLKKWLTSQKIELPPMADATVLTRFSAGFDLMNQGAVTQLDNLKVSMDDTTLDGNVKLNGTAVGFKLNVDAIDADRYLPAAKIGEQPQDAPQSSGDEPLLPIETLRELNVDGVLSIGKLTIQKLLAEQIELSVKAKNGQLAIDQAIKKFYQGALSGKVNLDVTGKTPRMNIDEKLTGLQAGPLLQDLMDDDKLTGKGNFSAKLMASGNSVNAIKKSLGGNLDFAFKDGAVKGFNLAQVIRDTRSQFQGQGAAARSGPAQTDFSELSGSAVITNGVVKNQDLLAKSPYLRVTGEGTVNLVPETLDYTVTPVIVSTEKGQGGEGLDDLKGVPIPVRLTGSFAAPSFAIDWGQVLAGTQKAKLEEKKQELKQKVQEQLQDQLGDKLKGLFN